MDPPLDSYISNIYAWDMSANQPYGKMHGKFHNPRFDIDELNNGFIDPNRYADLVAANRI